MARNVFRSQEVVNVKKTVVIDSPFQEEVEEALPEIVEEYSGPTADDLRREAEAFRAGWDTEKASMRQAAKEEADQIIKNAEQTAFNEVKKKIDEAQKTRQEAEDEAKRIVLEAEKQAESDLSDVKISVEAIKKEAYAEGFEKGSKEGYTSGREEVERLIEQLHNIINKAIEKRNEIIDESESQLIGLVLLITKKVVKVISENQKNVVINNVIQSLRKLKSRGEVIIKVNLEDVELTSEHIKDFMRMVENIRSITVLEDSTVDRGGCIIETDFGEIDARIASQFHEIEEKIVELAPIKVKGEE